MALSIEVALVVFLVLVNATYATSWVRKVPLATTPARARFFPKIVSILDSLRILQVD